MAIAPRGLPVPPMPVLPPEGIAPVTDPAATGAAPDASPTTMVLQYLKSRGFTPSSENVRRALEANQRDPGVIPGLRSDRPATEAEDQAAMRAAGRGGGGPSNLVQEGGTWDMSSGRPQGATPPMDRRDTTSAAPASSSSSSASPPDADYSGPGWGTAAAAGTGLALANAILNRTPSAQFVGNAQMPTGKVTDVDLPPASALPSPAPTPLTLSLDKAVPPHAIAPPATQIAGPPPAAEAPVAPPGQVITPPVTPESNAPLPFSSTSPRRPPTPAELDAVARASRTSTTLRGLGNAARVMPR